MAKPTPPEDESKAGKFIRIAERRMTTAVESLRNLENLSVKATYEYDDAQVAAMLKTLRDQIDVIENCFAQGGKKQVENGFSFATAA